MQADDPVELWQTFVAPTTEEEIWAAFLRSPSAEGEPAALLERVRTREPLRDRPPTLALYEGLLLVHQRALTTKQLQETLDQNEALDRSLRAELLRSRFRIAR